MYKMFLGKEESPGVQEPKKLKEEVKAATRNSNTVLIYRICHNVKFIIIKFYRVSQKQAGTCISCEDLSIYKE